MRSLLRPLLLAAIATVPALPAHALDLFEIQVYEGDTNAPGDFGLELHTNYTVSGRRSAEWTGEVPPHHALRLTLEPAYGVTDWLELGAYLQFFGTPDAGANFGGAKLRAKFVVPERITGNFHFGLNMELGRVPIAVEEEGWANEFRPIIGWDDGTWTLVMNPIFGYALTGKDAFKPDLEPAFKAAWNTQKGFSIGAEYYAGVGEIGDLAPLKDQEHLLFAVFDLRPPKGEDPADAWELNVAAGHGLTDATAQQWIVKTIIGKSF